MKSDQFLSTLKNPLKFKAFLFAKLPLALFAGLRIMEINASECVVSVPYKWMNKNPFRSTYFAALAMAAELSTGTLAMAASVSQSTRVSLLVVKLEADYHKKATGTTYFKCTNGIDFATAINDAVETGLGQEFRATSVGVNDKGEAIATFYVTWSFKTKAG